jgi:hypothetical protein
MTSKAIAFGTDPVALDFTTGAIGEFGTEAQRTLTAVWALWSGNTVHDGKLLYTGQNNDRDEILSKIGGVVPTNVVNGFYTEDLNLDGRVMYTCNFNDPDLILTNIGGIVMTNERLEQLP